MVTMVTDGMVTILGGGLYERALLGVWILLPGEGSMSSVICTMYV